EARVHPDITFFGFDLTVPEAKGDSGDDPDDDAGWFFCIKERPGEPRFGFDIEGEAGFETVSDIAWSHVGTPEGGFVAASALDPVNLDLVLEPNDTEKIDQHNEDVEAVKAPLSAARWAYLTYQSPVLVAVHAAEMLPKDTPWTGEIDDDGRGGPASSRPGHGGDAARHPRPRARRGSGASCRARARDRRALGTAGRARPSESPARSRPRARRAGRRHLPRGPRVAARRSRARRAGHRPPRARRRLVRRPSDAPLPRAYRGAVQVARGRRRGRAPRPAVGARVPGHREHRR